MFITFEGIDGVGKTTQVALLRDYLVAKQYDVLCTREPGGCQFSENLRPMLKQQSFKHTTELLLQLASRAEHIRQTIASVQHDRKIILCDRFFDSTIAYQCFGIMALSKDTPETNQQACNYLSSLVQQDGLGYYTKMLLQKALEAELNPKHTIPSWQQNGITLKDYNANNFHNSNCLGRLHDFLLESRLNKGMDVKVWYKFSNEIVFDAKKFVYLINFLYKTQQIIMGIMPDVTFLFDLDWNNGIANRHLQKSPHDKYHLKGSAHRFLVGLGYRWIYAQEQYGNLGKKLPRRKFYRLNTSNKNIDNIHQDLIQIIDSLLSAPN